MKTYEEYIEGMKRLYEENPHLVGETINFMTTDLEAKITSDPDNSQPVELISITYLEYCDYINKQLKSINK